VRNISLKILFTVLIGVLVIAASQAANAQEFRKELMKGIIQTIGHDAFKDLAKSVIKELAKDEEFRKQVMQQIIRDAVSAIGPENIKEMMKPTAGQTDSQVPKIHTADVTAGADVDSVRNALVSIAGELTKDPAVMNTLSSSGPVTNPQALLAIFKKKIADSSATKIRSNPETTPVSKNFRNDLIAVITHPSNPVDSLTLDQVRKIFSGEYSNWSQVGGTDLPVQLVTSRDTPAALESLLDTHLAPSAARVPLLSYLFVGVAEKEGAVGFLPTANIEQLEFIRSHGAIKKIAIRKDDHSPAFTPNPGAVLDGSYPLLARDAN
jgi:hypothetical protein